MPDTGRRHDPPFGNTPACPMCPMAFRNLSAVVHNYLHDGNDYCDVRSAAAECADLITPDTASEIRSLVEAAAHHVKWRDRIVSNPNEEARTFAREQMWKWHTQMRVALAELEPLSDAHFADRLHSHGEVR